MFVKISISSIIQHSLLITLAIFLSRMRNKFNISISGQNNLPKDLAIILLNKIDRGRLLRARTQEYGLLAVFKKNPCRVGRFWSGIYTD